MLTSLEGRHSTIELMPHVAATIGFEPMITESKSDVLPLDYAAINKMAEGVGFEPTGPLSASSGFQDQRYQPLSHPSVWCQIRYSKPYAHKDTTF